MLAAIVVGLIAAMAFLIPYDTVNYLAASADKHRLLYSVDSPRMILVGGSNAAFSIDSLKISNYFDKPVVNTGLHVDVGLKYMLNEVGPALRIGDIVIIFPEYEHFYFVSLDGRPTELGAVIRFCPECVSGIRTPAQFFNVVTGITQMLEGDLLRGLNPLSAYKKVYFRGGFNKRGDMIAHLNQNDKLPPNNHVSSIKILSPNPAIDLLNSFYKARQADGVQVFFVFPAIPIDEYQAQSEKFIALYNLIAAELEIPILGAPKDFIYPENYFYDTVYHMNRIGREAHTADIIEVLTSVLRK